MQVKDSGHLMSNAEVLRWLTQKRAQHLHEHTPLAPNLVNSLKRHEHHLSSNAYPYSRNPGVYSGKHAERNLHLFAAEHLRRIQKPLMLKYNQLVHDKVMTQAKARAKLEKRQKKKELSEAEMLMIYNLAPTCVETLQPMIEEVEDRFTQEELEIIVECVRDVFRADEASAQNTSDKSSQRAQ